jgi:ketosteroid isomerase-like protein
MVDRETPAWNKRDAETLASLFHRDMVWTWPGNESDHDPENWIFTYGRYERERWKANWQKLFDTHTLIHNRRRIVKIVVSKQ